MCDGKGLEIFYYTIYTKPKAVFLTYSYRQNLKPHLRNIAPSQTKATSIKHSFRQVGAGVFKMWPWLRLKKKKKEKKEKEGPIVAFFKHGNSSTPKMRLYTLKMRL